MSASGLRVFTNSLFRPYARLHPIQLKQVLCLGKDLYVRVLRVNVPDGAKRGVRYPPVSERNKL